MKKIIVTLLLAALVLAAVPALAQNAFTAAERRHRAHHPVRHL